MEPIELELTIASPIELVLQETPPIYIVPVGVLPAPPVTPLPFFPNDEEAVRVAPDKIVLTYGDWYMLSEDSDVGPHGLPKMVTLT